MAYSVLAQDVVGHMFSFRAFGYMLGSVLGGFYLRYFKTHESVALLVRHVPPPPQPQCPHTFCRPSEEFAPPTGVGAPPGRLPTSAVPAETCTSPTVTS
jgi:hypothetical protein